MVINIRVIIKENNNILSEKVSNNRYIKIYKSQNKWIIIVKWILMWMFQFWFGWWKEKRH